MPHDGLALAQACNIQYMAESWVRVCARVVFIGGGVMIRRRYRERLQWEADNGKGSPGRVSRLLCIEDFRGGGMMWRG